MPKLTPAQMKAAIEEFKKKFTGGFYHGSPSNKIKVFDPAKGEKPEEWKTPGVTFVTRDSDFAESFLPGSKNNNYKTGATMYPVSVNLGKHWHPNTEEGKATIQNYLDTTTREYPSKGLLNRADWTEVEHPTFLDHLRNEGYNTFHVMEGGTPNVGVFDPKNIRGKFAKYNPEDAESADFMKAAGGPVGYAPGGKVGALEMLAKKLMPLADREANKAKFLEPSAIKNRMYHGTAVDISEFKPKQVGATFLTDSPGFAGGFADSSEHYLKQQLQSSLSSAELAKLNDKAYKLSRKTGESPIDLYHQMLKERLPTGQNIIPVHVQATNPFDYDNPEHIENLRQYLQNNNSSRADAIADAINGKGSWDVIEMPETQSAIKKMGHDSFFAKEGGNKNLGIYDPNKIKSAIGNEGTYDITNPDITKKEGGPVGYAPGGKVGALAQLGKALARHPHGQDPKVAQALEEYLKGNISQEERIRIMNQYLPMRKWSELPPNYTDEQIRNALMANKQSKALAPVPAGAQVGNRLDIPAYTQQGVYVDTTHDVAGKPISYGRTGHLKDVEFSSKPNQAVRVGLGTKEQALTPMGAEIGSAKSPFALIKGTNVGTSDDEVRRMMAEMLNDPNYTQIGMDPRRHSQFYDKSTGLPVFRAEEKLQSGPLILAPRKDLEITDWNDPRLELTDFPGKKYAEGGSVFNPEGTDYDYQTAIAYGMGPTGTGEDLGHWGSVAPTSDDERMLRDLPRDAYVMLKGKAHETFDKAKAAEKERGSKIVKIGDRYYSIPK